ncbi:MAG: ATP-binding cassette domain-containing protein [Pseudomonadota bacterium]
MVRLENLVVGGGPKGAMRLGPLSLAFAATGITAIMGANGAGKTTFLKVLHGLIAPLAGRVIWEGVAPGEQAFVFQQPILLKRSARENLELPLRLRGQAPGAELARLAADLELTALLDAPAHALSGGEAQRLALARALSTSPRVLFLDEPTANLDTLSAQAIEHVFAARAAAGTRLFIATHATAQARRLATEVIWIEKGTLIGPIPAPAFFASPPEAARLYLEAQS